MHWSTKAFSTPIYEGRIYAGSVTADLTDLFIESKAIFVPAQREQLKIRQDLLVCHRLAHVAKGLTI